MPAENSAVQGQKGFVVDTLDVLSAVEAVANRCGLIIEIPVTGDGVLLAIAPQNTKLFYQLHTSSLAYSDDRFRRLFFWYDLVRSASRLPKCLVSA